MTAWRQAGLNYINYSTIAARTLRKALKQELRVEAIKRDESNVRITPWVNGKPAQQNEDDTPEMTLVIGRVDLQQPAK